MSKEPSLELHQRVEVAGEREELKVGGDESDAGEVERKNEDEHTSEARDEGSE